MPAQLTITAGPDKGRSFPLRPGETFQVGRSQATPTRLTDASVSRVHFEVEYDGSEAVLVNISGNGTVVNGDRVERRELRPGDVIRVGATELRFQDTSAEPTTVAPAPKPPAGGGEQLSKLVGQTLSHYKVEEVIARGATGTVFRATDTKDGQTVALKVLQPEFSKNDEEMQRFVRSMKTVLTLRHPNLVALYGAGKTGPYCWVAMEHVEGESMTQAIQRIGVAGMLD